MLSPNEVSHRLTNLVKIGEGGSSVVYKANHQGTSSIVALKVIDLTDSIPDDIEALQSEIAIHKSLDHPFIVQYFGSSINRDSAWVAMEFIGKKTLLDYINNTGGLTEAESQKFFIQTISALQYLHMRCKLTHGDLKLENIVIDPKNNARLIDFGLCSSLTSSGYAFCGSLRYSAPEVIRKEEDSTGTADIWSMGVILYAMLFSSLPFNENTEEHIVQSILNKPVVYPKQVSILIRDLLSRMLEKDPKKRITIPEIICHKWVSSSRYSKLLDGSLLNRTDIRIMPQNSKHFDDKIIAQMIKRGVDPSIIKHELLMKKDNENTMEYRIFRYVQFATLLDSIRSAQKVDPPRSLPFSFLLYSPEKHCGIKKRQIITSSSLLCNITV